MKLLVGVGGKFSTSIEVCDLVFNRPFNESLIHQVVTAYLAGGRSGSKAQKNRGDVRGSGKKPWRQKGTGRARAGTIRSPLWRTGGVTFAARRRDYSQKVNKKAYRVAMTAILSELVRQDRLVLVQTFQVSQPKTHLLFSQLEALGLQKATIICEGEDNKHLTLASRNLPDVTVLPVIRIDPVTLLRSEKILLTVTALKKLEERFS